MSAKEKAAAAPQDESPEQIVEDVGANESRPQGEGAAISKSAEKMSVRDTKHLTVVDNSGATPLSPAEAFRDAVEEHTRATVNAIVEAVVTSYLNTWDVTKPPTLRTVEMELLGEVNHRIGLANIGLDSNERLPRLQSVTPRMAARVFCHTHLTKQIVPNGIHTDDVVQRGLLCAYQLDGEFEGTYRRIDLGILEQFADRIHPGNNEQWQKELERKIRMIVPKVSETNDRDLVMMKDCIFNYATKEYLPFTPEVVRMSKAQTRLPRTRPALPVATNADGTTITPDEVLSALQPTAEGLHQMLQTVGMALRPQVSWNVAALYYSPSGSNGKGTMLEWIEAMVGSRQVASVSPAAMSKSFGAADLIGKSLNLVHEVDAGDFIEKGAMMKQLITNDSISIECKYRDPIKVRLMVANIWSVNEIPVTRDKTGSMFRRWLVVMFQNRFLGVKENKAIKDDYIRRTEWCEYLAYKVLVELEDYYSIMQTDESTLTMDEHRAEVDGVYAFATQLLPQFTNDVLPFPMLHALYVAWSKVKNPKGFPEKEGSFTKHLKSVVEEVGGWTTVRAPSGKSKEYTVQNVFVGDEPVLHEYLGAPENEKWLWISRPHIAGAKSGLGLTVPRVAPALVRVGSAYAQQQP